MCHRCEDYYRTVILLQDLVTYLDTRDADRAFADVTGGALAVSLLSGPAAHARRLNPGQEW